MASRHPKSTAYDLIGLIILAAVIRCIYLLSTWHVYGDAVQYADIANRIANGLPITPGLLTWVQSFSFWEVPFHWLFDDPIAAAATASLIPGAVLSLPTYFLARSLYGRKTALFAGAIIALHPFLVHYSTNGYLETLYLLFFTSGIAALTSYIIRPSWWSMAIFGAAFGLALTVRNEVAPVFAAGLILPITIWIIRRIQKQQPTLSFGSGTFRIGVALACFATVVTAFGLISDSLTGTSGLFQKTENFSRVYDIHAEKTQAAKELLGAEGHLATPGETQLTPSIIISTLLQRLPRNLVPLAKSIPPVLANPIFLLSLIPLLLWWRNGHRIETEHLPALMMFAFAPSFYVLFFVEPRYLIASLIPLTVYSAEGFRFCLAAWPTASKARRGFIATATTFCLVLFVAAAFVKTNRTRKDASLHLQTANAFEKWIPADESVVGCGFGYITDTAFRSGHAVERRLVTDDPNDLAPYVQSHHSRWLVLYQGFLTGANPALLKAFDSGIPGFDQVEEVATSPGHRAKIFRLKEDGIDLARPSVIDLDRPKTP